MEGRPGEAALLTELDPIATRRKEIEWHLPVGDAVADRNETPGGRRRYSVAEPGLERGFVQVPKWVLLDPSLTLVARMAYAILLEFAWRSGGDPEPEIDELAAALTVGRSTTMKAIRELVAAGLVESKRRGQGRPNAYSISLSRDGLKSKISTSRSPDSTALRARAGDQTDPDLRLDETASPSPEPTKKAPPPNLLFEAIARVCGIDWKTDKQAAKEVGIAAARIQQAHGLDDGDPADLVDERADLYRRVMNDAILSPLALAKWWQRLPKLAASAGRRGVSAADLFAEAQAEHAADQERAARAEIGP